MGWPECDGFDRHSGRKNKAMKMQRSTARKALQLVLCTCLLSACASLVSVVYPLNENAAKARAGAYRLDDDHASVLFELSHFGFSSFRGRFDTLSGSLDLDPQSPENSSVTVTLSTGSLHTGVPALDEQLRAPDMFDTALHPEAQFTSGTITLTSDNSARIEGVLTIKGLSRPMVLDATFIGSGTNPLTGQKTVGFAATGIIKRSDFGLDNWLPFVADDVSLTIDVEFAETR